MKSKEGAFPLLSSTGFIGHSYGITGVNTSSSPYLKCKSTVKVFPIQYNENIKSLEAVILDFESEKELSRNCFSMPIIRSCGIFDFEPLMKVNENSKMFKIKIVSCNRKHKGDTNLQTQFFIDVKVVK